MDKKNILIIAEDKENRLIICESADQPKNAEDDNSNFPNN